MIRKQQILKHKNKTNKQTSKQLLLYKYLTTYVRFIHYSDENDLAYHISFLYLNTLLDFVTLVQW
jgi:hypothetical protein